MEGSMQLVYHLMCAVSCPCVSRFLSLMSWTYEREGKGRDGTGREGKERKERKPLQ